MSFLVVPHQATSSAVTIWVGAVRGDEPRLELEVGREPSLPLDAGWSSFQAAGAHHLWWQRVTVDGLAPGTRYPLRLLEQGAERAQGTAVTLPASLPRLDEQPFICLLGSCFALLNDQAGAAGAAYAALPAGARPSVKFLCGDQVYLDAPFPKYLFNVYPEPQLRSELLATYLASWTQAGDRRGFNELLRDGATWFCSDDHELWNNAPSPTPIVRATWWPLGDGGAAWLRAAGSLYDIFQTPSRSSSFEVGQLSFRVLDTRLGRLRDRSLFADAAAVSAVAGWVAGLQGPGVLVVGQPIFVAQTGLRGHLTDWGLADFGQFGELARALSASQHDVVVLTGDVHFGRVAGCRLPSGASLLEIIASPFALIDARFGGKWSRPPHTFPAAAVEGISPAPIWVSDHQLATNHFATLEFADDGGRVQLTMRAWPIPTSPGQAPVSRLVMSRQLN
ncbi:MAG TPA: hypothetical protein VMP67_04585 [Candidatus Limnocylindria bacterium]|nr:hypothetical protein [Candidatus Limnocylindria bacterium]